MQKKFHREGLKHLTNKDRFYDRVKILLLGRYITKNILQHKQFVGDGVCGVTFEVNHSLVLMSLQNCSVN